MAGNPTNGRIERALALCDRSRNIQQKAVLLVEVARIRNSKGTDLVAHSTDLFHASPELRQRKPKRR